MNKGQPPTGDQTWRFLTPGETAKRLANESLWKTCQNLGLLLHTYLPFEAIGTPQKLDWLRGLASRSDPQKREQQHLHALFDSELHERWVARWLSMTAAVGAVDGRNTAIRFTAKCAQRLIVGMGGPSPLETDMTLHHVYGLPYLPGSALKGLAHAYATLEVEQTDETKGRINRIFGTDKAGGSVIFFDAIPGPGLTLDVDILNPHYPVYYRQEGPPSDDQSPVPVFFLTMRGATFHFAVAPRPGAPTGPADVAMAKGWLESAIQELGVGGKTSSGYGRFDAPTATK